MKENGFTKGSIERGWYVLGTTTILSMLFFVTTIVVTFERNVFSSNYNSKINIRNVKGRRDGMPKQNVCNKVGMMHESKGQLIGKLSPIPTPFSHYSWTACLRGIVSFHLLRTNLCHFAYTTNK